MKKFTASFLLFIAGMLYSHYAKAVYNNNYSAVFNGTNAFLKVQQTQADMQLHDPFTIEFWMNPRAYPVSGKFAMLFQKANPVNTNGIYISMDSDGLIGASINQNYYTSPAPAVIGFWTHVAIEYATGSLKMFFNGAEVVSIPLSAGDVYQPYAAFIGAMSDASGNMLNFYNGELDELRVWGVYRLKFDIENYCHQSVTGMGASNSTLRISLPFNNNFTDQGGREYNTVVNKKVAFVNYSDKNPPYLAYNASLYLAAGSLSAPDQDGLDASTGLTMECWFRSLGTGGFAMYKGLGDINYRISLSNNNGYDSLTFMYLTPVGTYRVAGKKVPPVAITKGSGWNHIAFSYTAATGRVRIYYNAQLILDTVLVAGENLTPNDGPLMVYLSKGCLDELRIWKNTVRTGSQIKSDMFKGYNYTMAPLPANVVVYNFDGRMDDVMKPLADSASTLTKPETLLSTWTYDYFTKTYSDDDCTAPLLRSDKNSFCDTTKYIMSAKRLTIEYNQPTFAVDSVYIGSSNAITDLKVFVLANIVSYGSQRKGVAQLLKLTLISPKGRIVKLTPDLTSNYIGKNLFSVFDMSAPETINYEGFSVLPPFSPEVKPFESFDKLLNKSPQGWWKIKMQVPAGMTADNVAELFGWGIYPITAAAGAPVQENTSVVGDKVSFTDAVCAVFPNPFMNSINITYQTEQIADVQLTLTDINGKPVAAPIARKSVAPGNHYETLSGNNLSAGTYICNIIVGNKSRSFKLVKQ